MRRPSVPLVHRVLVALALLSVVLSGPVVAQDDVAAIIARIEGPQKPDRQGFDGLTIEEMMTRFRLPRMTIAAIKAFNVHWAKGYGVADVTTGRRVETNTPFQAASISKPVTAMAVVKLAQEGKLSLDQDVNALLTSWRVPESEFTRVQPVTLRSLLSHTSGADDGFGFPGYKPDAPRPTLVQLLNGEKPSNVGPVRFARPVYAGQKYSGGGTEIVQLTLTDLTKKPFAQLMQETVLGPIGMTESSFEQPPVGVLAERTARAHSPGDTAMDTKWHVYPEQAAAGLWTTATDLAKFAWRFGAAARAPAGKVLWGVSAREMIAPTGLGSFAVGLMVEKRGEGWYFMHSGGNWGFSCNMIAHVRKGYGVVIMINGGSGPLIREVEERVAAAYGWDNLDKPIPR